MHRDQRMIARLGASFIGLLLLATQVAAAQVRVDEEGERLVREFVARIDTMQGSFEQALVDARGEVVERSTGTLEIERPGKFRWTYAEPYEQQLVADGLNIWSYDVDLAQVTVKPQAEALANTPALLLGGDEEALSQFRFDGATLEDGTIWVRMIPVDTSSGFERMELGFVDGQFNRMAFFDNLEQTTLVALSDLVTNVPFAPGHFAFAVPDDADLVGIPAVAADITP
jgi:outer membrane lipoprotein carrier protein